MVELVELLSRANDTAKNNDQESNGTPNIPDYIVPNYPQFLSLTLPYLELVFVYLRTIICCIIILQLQQVGQLMWLIMCEPCELGYSRQMVYVCIYNLYVYVCILCTSVLQYYYEISITGGSSVLSTLYPASQQLMRGGGNVETFIMRNFHHH